MTEGLTTYYCISFFITMVYYETVYNITYNCNYCNYNDNGNGNYNYVFQNTANLLLGADSGSRPHLMFGHVHKFPLETRECGANKDETHTHFSDGNICISLETDSIPTNHKKNCVFHVKCKSIVFLGVS